MDSFVVILVSLCFSLLFAFSALHKLQDLPMFAAVIADYRLLPASFSVPVAWCSALFELGLSGAWLVADFNQAIALSTAMLLAGYTSAIGLNLVRGRVHISCGCGGNSDHLLSWHLVARNGVLVVAALSVLVPFSPRPLSVFEWVTVGAAVATGSLLYLAYTQIQGNALAIRLWVGNDD